MKPLNSLGAVFVLAAALTLPAEAKPKKAEGKQRPAAVQKSRPVAIKQQARPKANVSAQRQLAAQRSVASRAAAVQRNTAQSRALARQRNVASQRSFATQQRSARDRDRLPAIAERDRSRSRSSTIRNRTDNRRYEYNTSHRSYEYNHRPPHTVWRNWDTRRVHWWNSRPYRWLGSEWVFYRDYAPYNTATTTVVFTPSTSSTSLVSDVQAALDDAGYDPGPVDGVLGSETRDAIMEYQDDFGLPVTGRLDSDLLRSLGL